MTTTPPRLSRVADAEAASWSDKGAKMRNDTSERCPWGKIVEEHEIGPYHFVEYKRFKMGSRRETEETTEFSVYIDGRSTRCGAATLDGALLIAVATRNLGPHSAGLGMIGRALCLKESL